MLDKTNHSFKEVWEFFKDGSKENTKLLWSEAGKVNVLAKHLAEKEFGLFIVDVIPHIKLKTCNAINLTNTSHQELILKLYSLACMNEDRKLFKQPIFDFLRNSTKKILLNGLDETPEPLKGLVTEANKIIEKFKDNLVAFERANLYKDDFGVTAGLMTKETQVTAYKALQAATIRDPATTFTDIFDTINEQTPNINLAGFLRVGLKPYVEHYKSQYKKISMENFYSILQSTHGDEALFRSCLLNDLFYNLLSHAKMDTIHKFIDSFPNTFFQIMLSYRVRELRVLFRREKQETAVSQKPRYIKIKYKAYCDNKNTAPAPLTAASLLQTSPVPLEAAATSPKQPQTPTPAQLKTAVAPAAPRTPIVSSSASRPTPIIPAPLRPANGSKPPAAKNPVLPLQPQPQKIQPGRRLKRIDDDHGQFQFLETESFVILGYLWKRVLRQLDERLKSSNSHYKFSVNELEHGLPDQEKSVVRFMPPLALKNTNRPKDLAKIQQQNDETLMSIKKMSVKNKGKICVGVPNYLYNEVGYHWIVVAVYTSPIGNDQTQVLILDPAFESEESEGKQNTVNYIRSLFKRLPNVNLLDRVFMSQQLNDADCAVACYQTVFDMLEKNAITIENNLLVLHRDKLTLDGERYIDKEETFRELLHATRSKLEGMLESHKGKQILLFDMDEVFAPGPIYDFDGARRLTNLKLEGNMLRSELLGHFMNQYLPRLEVLFRSKFNFSMENEHIAGLVKQFQEEQKSLIGQYLAVVRQIQALKKAGVIGELIHFDLDSIDQDLIRKLQEEYQTQQQSRPLEHDSPPAAPRPLRAEASKSSSATAMKLQLRNDSPATANGAALNGQKVEKPSNEVHLSNIQFGLKLLTANLSKVLPDIKAVDLYNRIHALHNRAKEWSIWFERCTPELCRKSQTQAFARFIAKELYGYLERETAGMLWKNYNWNDGTVGGAIKLPLAKILGMSQEIFTQFNSVETREFLGSDATTGEPVSSKDSGYKILLGMMKTAINRITVGTAEIKDLTLQDSQPSLTN